MDGDGGLGKGRIDFQGDLEKVQDGSLYKGAPIKKTDLSIMCESCFA